MDIVRGNLKRLLGTITIFGPNEMEIEMSYWNLGAGVWEQQGVGVEREGERERKTASTSCRWPLDRAMIFT